MTNHYHLVIKTGNLPLWRAIGRFQADVAREHNRRKGVKGPLWQSRYKARLVRDNADVGNLVAYVHLNPVRAGIVDDPADFKLSGHRAMIGIGRSLLLDVAEALLTYDEAPESGMRVYLEQLRSTLVVAWKDTPLEKLPWWQEVNDKELTMPNVKPPPEAEMFDGQRMPPEEHLRPAPESVLEYFEARYGLPTGRLSGNSQSRIDSRYRRLFSTIAVCRLGFRVNEIARLLNKAPGSVSRWISEGYELLLSDATFRNDLAHLRRGIDALPAADGPRVSTQGENS
jgi:hypothetical protein